MCKPSFAAIKLKVFFNDLELAHCTREVAKAHEKLKSAYDYVDTVTLGEIEKVITCAAYIKSQMKYGTDINIILVLFNFIA